jgi:predicted nucleic acid-binding protein
MKTFVDTWGWLVAANRADKDHDRVSKIFKDFKGQFYTTDYVLNETITMMFSRHHYEKGKEFIEGILQTSSVGALTIVHINKELFLKAWALRLKYKDKPNISFVDFSSFAVMHEYKVKEVITGDKHFEEVGMGFMRI